MTTLTYSIKGIRPDALKAKLVCFAQVCIVHGIMSRVLYFRQRKLKGTTMDRTTASDPALLSAQLYAGIAGLKQLRNDWNELTPDAQLFARYEWNLAAAMHLFGEDNRLWFCRISDHADKLLAIIPAVSGHAAVRPFGLLPALTLGMNEQLTTFDFPMSPDANAFAVGKAMLKAFKQLPVNWRVISWARVLADSNAAKVATAVSNWRTDITPAAPCGTFYTASTPDPSSNDKVFAIESTPMGKRLGRFWRRLERQGPVQIRFAREQGDIEGFFREFLRIESSGWKGEKGARTAIALVPDALRFFKTLLAESNENFQADIALLYCGDKAVVGVYLMRTGHWEYHYKIGYDEAFSASSPGLLSFQLLLERAKVSEAVDYVSVISSANWLKDWAPIAKPTLQINIFNGLSRPTVVRLGRRALAEYKNVRQLVAQRSGSGSGRREEQSMPADSPHTE